MMGIVHSNKYKFRRSSLVSSFLSDRKMVMKTDSFIDTDASIIIDREKV